MDDPKPIFAGVTRRDTDKARSRTFKRRSFVLPTKERAADTRESDTRGQIDFGRDSVSTTPGTDEGGGGGGVPDGYVETDVILCQNGTPVAGQILFKED